jgi:hypothetical protein
VRFINLTAHDVHVFNKDESKVWTFKGTKNPARISSHYRTIKEVGGVPLLTQFQEDPTDLPSPQEDIIYIVSAHIKQALPHRKDLAAPVRTVRDAYGNIKGCKGLWLESL